jgi:alkylhydroperoxidase family enzyme
MLAPWLSVRGRVSYAPIGERTPRKEARLAWIHVIPELSAEGDLQVIYDELYAPYPDEARGQLDNILQIHSLVPQTLRAHLALYRSAMTGTETLPKVDREMIADVVSGINGCHY